MATKLILEIEAKTAEAQKDVEKLTAKVENLEKQNKDLEKQNEATAKSAKGIGGAVKGIGTALKAIGIGIALALFAKLAAVFTQNQKVVDFFSTAMNTLTIAFNDFFNFVFNNFGGWIDSVKSAFEDPQKTIKDLGTAIQDNLIKRLNSLIKTGGLVAKAFKQLFAKDFAGAWDTAKEAAESAMDSIINGEGSFNALKDGVVDAANAVKNYAVEIWNLADAITNASNNAQIAAAQQGLLVEHYDRLAEKQRQIRDEERNTIEDRIAANNKLDEILDDQEKAMRAQADLQVSAAEANLKLNGGIENQVALIDALANKEAVLAQIEGFRSEQLVNDLALKREQIQLEQTLTDAEKDRQIKQLEFEASQQRTEEMKLEKQRQALQLENQLIEEDIERKRELYLEGTQARVDAEIEYESRKQDINNALIDNERLMQEELNRIAQEGTEIQIEEDEKKRQSQEALEDAKYNLANAGLQAIQQLAKKGSKAAKFAAVAQATISTYQGINKALAETTDPTPTQSLRLLNAAAVGIMGFLNVANILKTNESGEGSVSAPSSAAAPTPPSFNVVGNSGTSQIAQALNNEQQPVQAYVVSGEMTSQQEMDRNIRNNASIG